VSLLFGDLVANFRLVAPHLHVNRAHLRAEQDDPTPVEERGWQHAVRAMYPLEVNELRVEEGRLSYIDHENARPLTMRAINGIARNIRNTRSETRPYPSPLEVTATVFDSGRPPAHGAPD
jgi:hypothetical protein